MKKNSPFFAILALFIFSCSHKYYKASNFEEKTADHKLVAILPAEMIFTGKQPKNLSEEQIAAIEEQESIAFQQALYNSILRYANSNKYETTVNFQDLNTTTQLLEKKNITVRQSWKMDDRTLSQELGVDAVIRMRIQKQRYMSDEASYGITVAKQIVFNTGISSKIPVPGVPAKTNDIYSSCNLVCGGETLWNDSYKSMSDYNSRANDIIEGIADNFGKHFPYKRRR